ncbi:MAG TPA: cytochrome c [Pyrinomonadaceae bacterium]|nr:cytochrome c [Pyrinomonadaceae bacterium]
MIRTNRFALVVMLLLLSSLAISLESWGYGRTQNPIPPPAPKSMPPASQQPPPGPPQPVSLTQPPESPSQKQQQDFSKNTWELPEDADKTPNPVPATPESIAKGKELYFGKAGNCVFCHGDTGSGNEANLPKLRRKPADISNKERMAAMTDGEIFWKVSKGINGIMPAGEKRMSEEERWHVVNYVRTLAKDKPKS